MGGVSGYGISQNNLFQDPRAQNSRGRYDNLRTSKKDQSDKSERSNGKERSEKGGKGKKDDKTNGHDSGAGSLDNAKLQELEKQLNSVESALSNANGGVDSNSRAIGSNGAKLDQLANEFSSISDSLKDVASKAHV